MEIENEAITTLKGKCAMKRAKNGSDHWFWLISTEF